MAIKEVVSLDESTPQLVVPQSGDTYEMPRDVNITGDFSITGTQTTAGNIVYKLSDNAGASKVSITDSDDAEVASIDSEGRQVITATLDDATGNEIALDLQYTVNKATSGNDTGIVMNWTNTASPGTSNFFDFLNGGASKLFCRTSGALFSSSNISSRGFILTGLADNINWRNGATRLYSDADDQLDMRFGTDSQTLNIFNTYTDASNYERLSISGDGTIATEAAGTGTDQGVKMSQLTLDPDQTLGTTTGLWFGDGDTGIYEQVDDRLYIDIAGSNLWRFQNNLFYGTGAVSPQLQRTNALATPPFSFNADTDTGMYWVTTDSLGLVAGGVEGIRVSEASSHVIITQELHAGLTADVSSVQGGLPLLSSLNEISTCANAGDAATLPTAVAGIKITIINNGANACDVFPASGDDLGAGADTAASLAAGANITYLAYDATNWAALT